MLLCQVFCFWVKEKEEEIFDDGADNMNSFGAKYIDICLQRFAGHAAWHDKE
jgi:hypothetical protein